MKMHESIVKEVYLDGNKYEIREEDGIIEDEDRNGELGYQRYERFDLGEDEKQGKQKKKKNKKGLQN